MPANPKPACPVCGRAAAPSARPFCSPRCRSVDLGHWLGGTYAIPGEPETEEENSAER